MVCYIAIQKLLTSGMTAFYLSVFRLLKVLLGAVCVCASANWTFVQISVSRLELLIAYKIDCVATLIHHTLHLFDHFYISMHIHIKLVSGVHAMVPVCP